MKKTRIALAALLGLRFHAAAASPTVFLLATPARSGRRTMASIAGTCDAAAVRQSVAAKQIGRGGDE